mmetsp:Transcript_32884/g.78744  ORF Transcript_32884/g.78744 Transcript_32884/m.78744 type:complete len:212 (+) Transcript_32884:192-827(+)
MDPLYARVVVLNPRQELLMLPLFLTLNSEQVLLHDLTHRLTLIDSPLLLLLDILEPSGGIRSDDLLQFLQHLPPLHELLPSLVGQHRVSLFEVLRQALSHLFDPVGISGSQLLSSFRMTFHGFHKLLLALLLLGLELRPGLVDFLHEVRFALLRFLQLTFALLFQSLSCAPFLVQVGFHHLLLRGNEHVLSPLLYTSNVLLVLFLYPLPVL